jgi:hypothetical protein
MRMKELDCKVSLSLDVWTSSNQHAFLAIVMHYITNDWKLGSQLFLFQFVSANNCIEELLINFRELVGKHTGENLAEAVWDTIIMDGLQG